MALSKQIQRILKQKYKKDASFKTAGGSNIAKELQSVKMPGFAPRLTAKKGGYVKKTTTKSKKIVKKSKKSKKK